MKISTKARYGIKALIDLGVYSQQDHVALKAIADRQSISERYLEQVFSTMRKAGLVKSVKGPQGGYLLACDPTKTNLFDVIVVLEGYDPFSDGNFSESKDALDHLVDQNLWEPLDGIIKTQLEALTLDQLIKAYGEATNPHQLMFFI